MRIIELHAALIFVALSNGVAATAEPSQVDMLLKQRPVLATALKRHPAFRTWIDDAFGGKFTTCIITWHDDDAGLGSRLGEHSYTTNGDAVITVSRKPSPIDQLVISAYECISVRFKKEWFNLWASALAGRLSKREFIATAMRLEHKVTLGTKDVLQRFLALTSDEITQAPNYEKIVREPKDFEAAMKYYDHVRRPEFDAREDYGAKYDSLVSRGVLRSQ